jgi:basic membrane lipoprotein Med (substrate-binding protein (PBP1-ABC) superfamily)
MIRARSFVLVGLVATLAALVAASALAGPHQKRFQVRVVTATPVTAGVWDPANYAAYTAVARKRGWNLEVAEALAYGKADQVFEGWGQEGVDLVFSTDNGFEKSLLRAAAKYPDTKWVLMTDISTTNGLANVAGYGLNFCDVGFLQGAALALVSKTRSVGLVGAIPILPAVKWVAGVRAGAEAAVPGTKVTLKYSGDFIDAAKGQEVASAVMGGGADAIGAVTHGGISPAIAQRVQSAGRWYVGSIANETKSAPKATVASVLLSNRQGYERVGLSVLNDTFKAQITHNGVKEGFVRVTPFRLGFQSKNGTLQRLVAKLKGGGVTWPKGACSKGV